ncbi:host-nuclease inhibitor Gam family protein [Pseudodesulfovibrio indicus]|uniref:Host-nuclease inhibitor protein Gam n=1 Tax=Pseudodesulfovibrio indicus TaxID=1716143 RepID=A0A140D8V5_9BACT|nr:host-nuclease inhibitor Gam family protein [Pseudodesulfovibrio indicus]AMK09622.1 host-nuclease inhibitor protein Gam [Pseudodesulfovibrio indicus]TDT86430.1 phage host-nuclease inhibitor protein Gam [Pseudodesulfovibrio indicus]
MARTKPNTLVITTANQAEEAMLSLARLTRKIKAIELDAQENIDTIKTNAVNEMEPLKATIKELGDAVCTYATLNKDQLFKGRKSLETPYGVFGWRKATKLLTIAKMNLSDVLERLRELNIMEAIKTKESVDKTVMRDWTDAKLQSVGMRRVVSDEFFLEPNDENVGGES